MVNTRRCLVLSLLTLCLLLTGLAAMAQEGKLVREMVYSPSLEGNLLGDSPKRAVTIYLPPSYDLEPDRRYPVVYLLHGYTGSNELWTGGSYISGNILYSMRSWLKSGKVKEMILVMPNSHNKFRGSFYTNSITTGGWADFIAKDLVEYIDNHYRTLPQRESRAVIGHSMGGYGGIKLGLLYPDVFGCMGGLAGIYHFDEERMKKDSGSYAFCSTLESWNQFYGLSWQTQAMFAEAAAFAPNPDKPPFYCDFPYTYTDTKPRKIVKNEEAYKRFQEHDLLRLAEKRIDVLRNMRAIYVDCGTSDELIDDARKLHQKLEDLGVKHVYREFPGSHICCVMTSTGEALEVFSNAMAFEPVVSVEPRGKLAITWGEIRRRR
ncbi:TPA: hypothetical protein ENG04_09490 [Candidatus Poribacteria bacterium]|nr:hypothetical protein [Candidatus Poribacteria bacterium]HEX30299.1 hypothetical protein [Candidatus Poribacteria bacterium]